MDDSAMLIRARLDLCLGMILCSSTRRIGHWLVNREPYKYGTLLQYGILEYEFTWCRVVVLPYLNSLEKFAWRVTV